MPRIDPQQLLKCLSVLLSPQGGIKSKDEVQRLASLMTKFSKKLVSKCIYVSILKATETDLLIMFMSAGGWDLTYSWLSDGVAAKNWPLVTELVDLLLICPVDIDRLKTNACPKLIKTLSKDVSADEKVRLLACKLVEQWLRVVRGDCDPPTAKPAEQPVTSTAISSPAQSPEIESQTDIQDQQISSDKSGSASDSDVKSDNAESVGDGHLPVYKITIRDGKKVLAEISGDRRSSTETQEEEGSPGPTEDINQEEDEEQLEDEDLIKPVKINKKQSLNKGPKQAKKPGKVHSVTKKERESTDSGSSSGKSPNRQKDTKPGPKKTKTESPKVKPKGKTDLNNIKGKESGSTKGPPVAIKEPEDVISKPKEKLSLKNKKTPNVVAKGKEKSETKVDKVIGKESTIDDSMLTEKEKESLLKFITPPISKVGKIPKKTSSNKEEKQSEERNRTLKDESNDSKVELKKSIEVKKHEIKRPEKKYSISVEPKRSFQSDTRPKTVKTYNSKFRSTGLEEEIKPPPPRTVPKKPSPQFPPVLGVPDKKLGKRSSPPPEPVIPEKKLKQELPQDEKKVDKAGGIKIIPAKPKPMFLQESDVFMDAMLAANTMKEPRKRKRRASTSKDSGPDAKKDSPNHSPKAEETSPSSIKPTFKFYQDTLDTSTEEDKSDIKIEDDSESGYPDHEDIADDQRSLSSEDEKVSSVKSDGTNGTLRGVLMHLKSRRQKKTVTWKEDGLESIKYFDLDETERVNVTKNFADMKSMEREHERENFQIARKLAVDDIMEERTRWTALIPIDIAAAVVAPGKNSQEKDIQYAREKTVAAAHYFNKRAIPDTAEEPDLEIHATTDPVCIPLDDITGSTDSINDFTSKPWPEPRGQPPAPAPPPPPTQQPAFQHVPATPFPPAAFPPPIGPFMPMPATGDCWRSGDGKVVPMQPDMFPPQGMMPPPGMPAMGPGPMMMPPVVNPEMPFPMGMPGPVPGPNPNPEDMAHFGGGYPPMGPSPPHQMFGGPPPPPPPQGPQNNNFQNSGGGSWQGSGGGNWYQGGPDNDQPPHQNQGSGGGSNRYQGGGSWRGGSRSSRNPDGWGGGNSSNVMCRNIIKRGFCRNNNCRFRHHR